MGCNKALDELDIIENIIIGSWAEYLYPQLFETDFMPNIRTRDVDFFYRNINLPRREVPIISKLAEFGFLHDASPYTEVSKFYKEDLLELEFLTRVIGAGRKNQNNIKSLGIKAEGLREINILADYVCEVNKNDYCLQVPEPSAYIIQKILTNPTRIPKYKQKKDINAVEELLIHVNGTPYHKNKLKEIYNSLSKKQLKTVEMVLHENHLELFNET